MYGWRGARWRPCRSRIPFRFEGAEEGRRSSRFTRAGIRAERTAHGSLVGSGRITHSFATRLDLPRWLDSGQDELVRRIGHSRVGIARERGRVDRGAHDEHDENQDKPKASSLGLELSVMGEDRSGGSFGSWTRRSPSIRGRLHSVVHRWRRLRGPALDPPSLVYRPTRAQDDSEPSPRLIADSLLPSFILLLPFPTNRT